MAEQKANSKDRLLPVILLAAAPLIVFILAIIFASSAHGNKVIHTPETVRAGYETTPANYHVEASYSKIWHDYASDHILLIVLGLIVAAGGTLAYGLYINAQAKEGSFIPVLAMWLIGALLIFSGYATRIGDVHYKADLSESQYDASFPDLDSIFPTSK